MKRSTPLRRTPLARGKARLERRTRLRHRARTPKRYTVEGSDVEYLGWLHTQPCQVAVVMGSTRECRGELHAAHVGVRGLGQKCPDREAVPLCRKHHLDDSHGVSGFFAGMGKQARRDLYDEWIGDCVARFLAERGML